MKAAKYLHVPTILFYYDALEIRHIGLYVILTMLADENGVCETSESMLAKRISMSERNVRRVLYDLIDLGAICVDTNEGECNRITLLPIEKWIDKKRLSEDYIADHFDDITEQICTSNPGQFVRGTEQECANFGHFCSKSTSYYNNLPDLIEYIYKNKIWGLTKIRDLSSGQLLDSAPKQTLSNSTKASTAKPKTENENVEEVFHHWCTTFNKSPNRSKLSPKRRRLIKSAVATYGLRETKQCITGYSYSPHHMGMNDRDTKYNSLELILRDAFHIEQGLEFFDHPPRPKNGPSRQRRVPREVGPSFVEAHKKMQ